MIANLVYACAQLVVSDAARWRHCKVPTVGKVMKNSHRQKLTLTKRLYFSMPTVAQGSQYNLVQEERSEEMKQEIFFLSSIPWYHCMTGFERLYEKEYAAVGYKTRANYPIRESAGKGDTKMGLQ